MAFENLEKIQPASAGELRRCLENNLLPQSILFSGPHGSGRLTAALDLASVLTGADRNYLRTDSIVYFPYRELSSRVRTAVNLFRRQRTDKARLFLIETLRAVNMQYNGEINSSLPSSYDKLFQTARNVDIFLTELEDRREVTDDDIKKLESLKIEGNQKYLYFGKSGPTPVSIDQLRGVKEWMSTSSREKVVIIEEIESATEGAKNSILKMLEEPEEHLTIILISSQSQRIMETILSRVRKFNFPSPGRDRVTSLIRERFNSVGSYSSFDSFFFRSANENDGVEKIDSAVTDFVSLLVSSRSFTLEKEDELNMLLENLSAYSYFRGRAIEEIENLMIAGKIPSYKARKLLDVLMRWTESVETYNMNEKSGLDYIVREAEGV